MDKFLERGDLINGRFGEAVVVIDGNRESMFYLKNITAKIDIDRETIPRLGTPVDLSVGGSAKEIDDLKNAAIVKKNKRLLKVDTKKLIVDTISETIIYPNLKSEELQNAYGAMNISELLDKMLEGREYERFTDKLMKAQGFMDDPDVIIGDAKN